jgi:penicillin-binding protein 2
MKVPSRFLLGLLLLALMMPLLGRCGVATPTPTTQATLPTSTPPPAPTDELPPADATAYSFLQAWENNDFLTMYSMLSPSAQDAYSEDEFLAVYDEIIAEATIVGVSPRILAAYQPGTHADITFATTFRTLYLGEFEVQSLMPLTFESGKWGVDWTPALIFPLMSDQTFVRHTTRSPPRGNIYDRNGLGLAVQGERVEVGVVPAEIEDQQGMLIQLSAILGKSRADLRALYTDARPDWYVPLGTMSVEEGEKHLGTLDSLPGVRLRATWSRSYRPEIIGPHLVGVVGPIPLDEVELWRAQGYDGSEMVGQTGLERWGEPYLAGQRERRLDILTPGGQSLALLAEVHARENSNLYTTFDREFQAKVQEILGERLGAIAVLEAKTGRVLALATYPMFDPNLFATGISGRDWQRLQADGRRPLVNRATQGTYPLGSVFKIVTMIAGMEAGGLNAGSSFRCRGNWAGLGPQWPKTCWLKSGHGSIPLNRALTVSCDITFYQVGLMLNGLDQAVLPNYARSCGFGALTGIEVEEDPGLVPDAAWKFVSKGEGWAPGDAVNLAIGQGELLVTPLQTASLLAAVGNGGTLYRPQAVEMIASDPDNPDWSFEPVALARLPVTAENLAVIQDSLLKVTTASHGTAYTPFKGMGLPVAGKTGTAESGQQEPHAWFAGYAPADDPEIAVAVIVEHSGEGSVYAAPLLRKVVESYFAEQVPTEEAPDPTPTP